MMIIISVFIIIISNELMAATQMTGSIGYQRHQTRTQKACLGHHLAMAIQRDD